MLDGGPDRFRIELAEEDERFGRDAVIGVVPPAAPARGQWTRSLARMRSMPPAISSGPSVRTASSVASRG